MRSRIQARHENHLAAPRLTPQKPTSFITSDDTAPISTSNGVSSSNDSSNDNPPNISNDLSPGAARLDVVTDTARTNAARAGVRKMRAKKTRNSAPERCGECADCLWQAEICCEQARAAARLKRLEAACGLFATAQSLLKRAIASSGEACIEACEDAREKLKNISSEMATYGDLAKSAARPMHALRAAPFASSAPPVGECLAHVHGQADSRASWNALKPEQPKTIRCRGAKGIFIDPCILRPSR